MIPPKILPIVLLTMSNVFMTTAWYGHLKFTDRPLWLVILVSWGIAFFEYCLAVPANRYGSAVYNTAELKTMQEVITLTVFVLFSIFYLKEPLTINHAVGFALIGLGAFFRFQIAAVVAALRQLIGTLSLNLLLTLRSASVCPKPPTSVVTLSV